MPAEIVDLRSDTVTVPSAAMREVMAAAPVGDDVYDEDPSIRALEELAAELCGKEAGLFVPSGSMANVIAQMVHARPGDEIVVPDKAHSVLYEVGAGPRLAGVQYSEIAGRALFTAEELAPRIKAPTFHTPGTGAVWVENTHNMAGGRIFPQEDLVAIGELCHERGVPLHMDGARLFNAVVASGRSAAEIAAPVDTVTFCLSKGLGAPVGSVLSGTKEFRTEAHRTRKLLGGGMRQAGIVAAGGIFALEHHIDELAEDHRRARTLAQRANAMAGLAVELDAVETNIVMADVESGDAEGLAERAKERGLLFHALEPTRVRFVTHRDLSDAAIERALELLATCL